MRLYFDDLSFDGQLQRSVENRILDGQHTKFIGQGRLMRAWSVFKSRLAALPERGNRRPGQLPALRLGRRQLAGLAAVELRSANDLSRLKPSGLTAAAREESPQAFSRAQMLKRYRSRTSSRRILVPWSRQLNPSGHSSSPSQAAARVRAAPGWQGRPTRRCTGSRGGTRSPCASAGPSCSPRSPCWRPRS